MSPGSNGTTFRWLGIKKETKKMGNGQTADWLRHNVDVCRWINKCSRWFKKRKKTPVKVTLTASWVMSSLRWIQGLRWWHKDPVIEAGYCCWPSERKRREEASGAVRCYRFETDECWAACFRCSRLSDGKRFRRRDLRSRNVVLKIWYSQGETPTGK